MDPEPGIAVTHGGEGEGEGGGKSEGGHRFGTRKRKHPPASNGGPIKRKRCSRSVSSFSSFFTLFQFFICFNLKNSFSHFFISSFSYVSSFFQFFLLLLSLFSIFSLFHFSFFHKLSRHTSRTPVRGDTKGGARNRSTASPSYHRRRGATMGKRQQRHLAQRNNRTR